MSERDVQDSLNTTALAHLLQNAGFGILSLFLF